MKIQLTDEQWEEFSQERDSERSAWIALTHEESGFFLYAEATIDKDDKAIITYTEANIGTDCFYGDKETRERFLEFGKRTKLNDKNNKCPNCFTPMIYRFNYCPKCGQILKWEEET